MRLFKTVIENERELIVGYRFLCFPRYASYTGMNQPYRGEFAITQFFGIPSLVRVGSRARRGPVSKVLTISSPALTVGGTCALNISADL